MKEALVFIAFISWLMYKRDLFNSPIRLRIPDYLFICILLYSLIFVVFPFGPASFLNKAIYFKNILMLGAMYFFGRVMILNHLQVMYLLRIILTLTILAFFVNLIEKFTNIHFQSLIGYGDLLLERKEILPTGNYGLTWTFEAQSGAKRFAAFFSSPLELAAAMLLSFSTALVLFLNINNRFYKVKYGALIILSIGCLLFAYSRSSLIGFFLLIFFIALVLGYHKLIIYGILSVSIFFGGVFIFAAEDLQYFVLDTLSLADSSSLSHVVEWLEGIESIVSSPFGIGLGTSGNAGGVENDMKIGGENQFIIFGVQLGLPFLVLYISLLISSIYLCVRSYKMAENMTEKAIPFIAATFKFAFLLPLMTANAENYLYVAYISWWMVGYSISIKKTIPNLPKLKISA